MNQILHKLLIKTYQIRILRGIVRKFIQKFEVDILFPSSLREIMRKFHKIEIGYGSYGGMYKLGAFKSGTQIGNYCSFAGNILQFNANHPYKNFTTHPILYHQNFTKSGEEELQRNKLTIGHDVWIGEWVIILPNVKEIGNGAIIGAGSIVTKDIPAYSIVAGNPARIIGKRFSESVIKKLEQTQWWNWEKDTLIKNKSELENIVNEK